MAKDQMVKAEADIAKAKVSFENILTALDSSTSTLETVASQADAQIAAATSRKEHAEQVIADTAALRANLDKLLHGTI